MTRNHSVAIVLGAVAIVAFVIFVAAVVTFALLQPPPPVPAPPLAVRSATPAHSAAPMPFPSASFAMSRPAATPAAEPRSTAGVVPAWESTIDGILRTNASETQMARMLINILPTLPEDGQIEAANHISNLLPDADYSAVRPLLLNANLPEPVLSVFFTDLMNRDDSTKLDAFIDIAQIPNHPFESEALSDLQIYVGSDYGTNWPQWKAAVSQYLKTANTH